MRKPIAAMVCVAAAAAWWTVAGRAADNKNTDWPAYAGDNASTKYSPLEQINKDNVSKLQIVWRKSAMPEELREPYPNVQPTANYQHTPLVIDGVMYMSSSVGAVVALDPATGKTLWFDQLPPRPDGQGV